MVRFHHEALFITDKTKTKMKKVLLTITIVFAMCIGCFAQDGGGLFQRGAVIEENNEKGGPGLPGHGQGGNQPAPIGTGTALLIGFGAAYAMYKKNKK